jgi:hypothetical protein
MGGDVMRLLLCLSLLALVVGCTNIKYLGDNYPPTTRVDIFFDEADVERPFKVMGHVDASASEFVSTEKMQEEIMKKAREVGADGIIFTGLDERVVSESSSWNESTKKTKKGGSVTSGSASTSTSKETLIKAVFIKYKDTE